MPYPLKKSFAAEQLKKRQKKNPATIIILVVAVIVAIAAVGYALYMRFGIKEIPTEEIKKENPSVAVLPFDNFSDDKEDEYFSDGITDDIITHLQKIRNLDVRSRTSIMQYKKRDKSLIDIAQELVVDFIVEGSVRRSDGRVRITAQLIDAKRDVHLWADFYDREREDIFAIQSDIARNIADTLRVELSLSEKDRLEEKPTDNLEAYDLYLLGRHYWYQTDGWIKALEYYLQAIEKDPEFALAYSGIADIYCFVGSEQYVPKFPLIAKAVAEKALELDSTIAEAHVSLARISLYYDYDWSLAESLCKRAIELNPGYDFAHEVYHEHLLITGRTQEALSEIKRAQELNPQFGIWIHLTMDVYGYLGRYDEAMEEYHKWKTMNPNRANYDLGRIYMYQGKYKEAIDMIEKIDKEHIYLAYLYAISGDRDRAQKIFDKYIEQRKKAFEPTNIDEMIDQSKLRKLAPYIQSIDIEQIITEIKEQSEDMKESFVSKYMVWIYTAMGENDKAFECLDELYEMRGTRMLGVTWEPELYPLHSDPRWAALMKKMGLPEE